MMRRLGVGAVVALVALSGLLVAWNGWPRAVPALAPLASPAPALPAARLSPCVLQAESRQYPRAVAVAGWPAGSVEFAFPAILVRHPAGLVLIDAPHGRAVQQDRARAGWIARRMMGDGSRSTPVASLLQRAGIQPEQIGFVAVTHAHHDHLGGLRDLPNAVAWMWERELGWARGLAEGAEGVLASQLSGVRLEPFAMDQPAYEGFPASRDLFGDGSLVAVPVPGHTPGSAAYFLNSADGRRWLFLGDAAWLTEGVTRPAHRGGLGALSDVDAEATSQSLARLHRLANARPAVQLVPSHDSEALRSLPACAHE